MADLYELDLNLGAYSVWRIVMGTLSVFELFGTVFTQY